jgi:hypothetical protein
MISENTINIDEILFRRKKIAILVVHGLVEDESGGYMDGRLLS